MTAVISQSELSKLANSFGITLCSAIPTRFLTADAKHLKEWQASNYHAEMKYMQRPAELLADPLELLPNAKSVISLALPYAKSPWKPCPVGYGRVARYAWGEDYHLVIKERLKLLVHAIEDQVGKFDARVFSDAVPMLERAWGREAGLGFIGKNTLLIRPKLGSFFFLAEIIADLVVQGDAEPLAVTTNCGSCTRCKTHCPTNAIVSDFALDARRCISYISIEKRGLLTEWEREALGEWIFGCDVCQEVCPFNHAPMKAEDSSVIPEFRAQQDRDFLNLREILSLRSEENFLKLFSKSALTRTGRVGLLRNAAVVAANTSNFESSAALITCINEDSSSVVRATSLWALAKLTHAGDNSLRKSLLECIEDKRKEGDPVLDCEIKSITAKL